MNPLYKGIKPKPDTFYKCIDSHGDEEIRYYAPDGGTLVFTRDTFEIPYPLPNVYALERIYCFLDYIPPEAIPMEVSVCERMSVCWIRSPEVDVLMLAYPQGLGHSVLEKGYGEEFEFMYSLADFDALCQEYCTVTGLGSLTRIGPTCWFTSDSCTVAMHKLIPNDFFGGPELYEEYGISDRELDEFLYCGEFHPWKDIGCSCCFYQYGDFIIYVPSLQDLAEEKASPLWFEWNVLHNAYVHWEDCNDMIPALAEPIGGKVNVGLYEYCEGSYRFALTLEPHPRKSSSILYSIGDLLTRISDMDRQKEIYLPIYWLFLSDNAGVQLEYRYFRSAKDRPLLEVLDMIPFE